MNECPSGTLIIVKNFSDRRKIWVYSIIPPIVILNFATIFLFVYAFHKPIAYGGGGVRFGV